MHKNALIRTCSSVSLLKFLFICFGVDGTQSKQGSFDHSCPLFHKSYEVVKVCADMDI